MKLLINDQNSFTGRETKRERVIRCDLYLLQILPTTLASLSIMKGLLLQEQVKLHARDRKRASRATSMGSPSKTATRGVITDYR